jgi:hypothetical protein
MSTFVVTGVVIVLFLAAVALIDRWERRQPTVCAHCGQPTGDRDLWCSARCQRSWEEA